MKNIITIATLLAAGTLVGNAATTITVADSTKTTSQGGLTYTVPTSDKMGWVSGEGLFENIKEGSTSRYVATTVFKLNIDKLSSVTSDTLLLTYQISSGNATGAVGLYATTAGLKWNWGGSKWSTDLNLPYDTLKTATYDYNSIDGTVLLGFRSTRYSKTESGSQVGNKDFTFFLSSEKLKSSNAYATIGINTEYISQFAVSSGLNIPSDVPEPSAFGLLAGLGALALAGARRRRSRK